MPVLGLRVQRVRLPPPPPSSQTQAHRSRWVFVGCGWAGTAEALVVLWEVERSAFGLEGGPFRVVLLSLGLLERRQILAGAAEGLRSGLLKALR